MPAPAAWPAPLLLPPSPSSPPSPLPPPSLPSHLDLFNVSAFDLHLKDFLTH